jgi:hypothetical protein
MAMRKALGSLLAVAMLAVVSSALADDEFDVSVSGTSVEVKTKGAWHVNKDGPWKAVGGGQTFDKTRWSLGENKASVSGLPHGNVTLKIYVCSGDKCKNAEKQVTVP